MNKAMKVNKMYILVLMLLTAGAVGAINYPTYKPTYYGTPRSSVVSSDAYNSGTMLSSDQQMSLTPMLSSDGTAANPYAGATMRKSTGSTCRHYDEDGDGVCDICEEECERNIGTGGDPDPLGPSQLPIGDAVPFLLLLAVGYAVAKRKREKRCASHSTSHSTLGRHLTDT